MKIFRKIVFTIIVFLTVMLTVYVIRDADSEYNIGLFLLVIIFGSIAGIITIWSYKSENIG